METRSKPPTLPRDWADGWSRFLHSLKAVFPRPCITRSKTATTRTQTQLPTHRRLLREFSGAIKAFLDDLSAAGLSDRVCVMGFSEFGRRVGENGSAGTDHGTAGPVFIAGDHVNAGLIGPTRNLSNVSRRRSSIGRRFPRRLSNRDHRLAGFESAKLMAIKQNRICQFSTCRTIGPE